MPVNIPPYTVAYTSNITRDRVVQGTFDDLEEAKAMYNREKGHNNAYGLFNALNEVIEVDGNFVPTQAHMDEVSPSGKERRERVGRMMCGTSGGSHAFVDTKYANSMEGTVSGGYGGVSGSVGAKAAEEKGKVFCKKCGEHFNL
jgi:hypothetical protein